MKGLRTQESKKFVRYFSIVQNKALEKKSVFFLDSGDGKEFETDEMEGENLQGWLVPFERVEEFESKWLKKEEDDKFIDFFCFVEWEKTENNIEIKFVDE